METVTVTLTEFLLARKTDQTEHEIIAEAAVDAVEMGLTPAETLEWLERFDRTIYAQSARLSRALRNLGWACCAVVARPMVKREAARWSDHPDYRDEWRP